MEHGRSVTISLARPEQEGKFSSHYIRWYIP